MDYTIKWLILKHAISYTGGSKRCNLCLEVKFCILKDIYKDNLLNKEAKFLASVVTKIDYEQTRLLTKFNYPSIVSPRSTVSPKHLLFRLSVVSPTRIPHILSIA